MSTLDGCERPSTTCWCLGTMFFNAVLFRAPLLLVRFFAERQVCSPCGVNCTNAQPHRNKTKCRSLLPKCGCVFPVYPHDEPGKQHFTSFRTAYASHMCVANYVFVRKSFTRSKRNTLQSHPFSHDAVVNKTCRGQHFSMVFRKPVPTSPHRAPSAVIMTCQTCQGSRSCCRDQDLHLQHLADLQNMGVCHARISRQDLHAQFVSDDPKFVFLSRPAKLSRCVTASWQQEVVLRIASFSWKAFHA